MAAQATRTRSTVVYFLQTHHKPAQVARLVRVITEGSPDAVAFRQPGQPERQPDPVHDIGLRSSPYFP